MEIFRGEKAIHVEKPEGTRINYYLFPEYEIHYNEVPPGTVQAWHHHERIEETLLMLDGELEVRWRNDRLEEQTTLLKKGDLVRTGSTPHTFANLSENLVKFVVFKLMLSGTNHHELFKSDRVTDE